jgi:1-acyl-sn-glycerol-3-phosphate acyltransferase
MIGDLLLKLHILLSRQKLVFFLSLLTLTCILAAGILRLKITESIFATLPKGKTFEEFNRLVENRNIINQIVFSIDIPATATTDEAADIAESFADSLRTHIGTYLKDIQSSRPDVQQNVYAYIYGNFPALIDTSYYQYLKDRTHPDSIRLAVASAHRQLLTPGGTFLKQFILNDPLGLTGPYFRSLNTSSNGSGLLIEDGVMFSKDRKQIIVMAATAYDSGNSEMNVILFNKTEALKTAWNIKMPENKFSYFGTFEIAARNAIQVKSDSLKTMVVAVIAILAILLLYYRKLSIPYFMILPGLFGGIFALGVIGFLRPDVSGISLATGAVIFGILLDYAFHFFTHLRHTGSVSITIKEVSAPLLTGSFTTIMAFSALYFANSVVLQDFGLFASLSLFGAAVFTLTALPVLLQTVHFDYQKLPKERAFIKLPKISTKFKRTAFLATMVLTLVFLYFSSFTSFDSNLDNLSLQSDDLKMREEALTGLNPKTEKRIYVFAANPNEDVALEANDQVYRKLGLLKSEGKIRSFVSPGAFLTPEKEKSTREAQWQSFWNQEKRAETIAVLNEASEKNGFNPTAFDHFKNWLSGINEETVNRDTLFHDLGLNNLIDVNASKTTIISTVVASPAQLPELKSSLRQIPGIEVFDRGELAGELLAQVKDDFNYILMVSASIVFLTLLLVYGRIELTLLSFLPMVISWIWILGIAALLDIKFNFVNVVITTFIFGLGDDFSIFVTDGLLSKYKEGKDTLRSYQSAILLSALTTIVGTGVLILAEHPAIHSVALISVLGVVCILFISFIVQPVLFDFFVQGRIEKKRAPVTLLPFLISISSFTYFLSGCLFLHSKLVTILLLPISKKRKKAMINNSLSFYAKTVIYSGPHVRKNISGTEHMAIDKPVIYIANHTSFLDILLAVMLNPKIILMVKGWVYKSPFFGPIIRYAGYVYTDDGPEENIVKLRKLVANGYSLLVFPEGTRSEDGKIGRFHKGAFHLANELALDIQPILIHGAADVLPKGDFLIRPGALNVRILPRITLSNQKWGENLRDKTKNISGYFKDQFAVYKDEMEDTSYLKHKIFTNYVFKGPVLEWYFKTKWHLEKKNYTEYNNLIGDRTNILDIGCGYGYLSFYLHYKNENRIITGIDYDDDKIKIAQNSYNKTPNLQFVSEDVMNTHPGMQDVIFLNDVLHYLSWEKQLTLLNRCAALLNPNGIIFIRDGITDRVQKHKNTERTEALSTGLFSFNKKQDEFHFFSSQDIQAFANKHDLTCTLTEHSKNTSNVLFILRKGAR